MISHENLDKFNIKNLDLGVRNVEWKFGEFRAQNLAEMDENLKKVEIKNLVVMETKITSTIC